MQNKMIKALALILAASVVFCGFAGCSSDDVQDNKEELVAQYNEAVTKLDSYKKIQLTETSDIEYTYYNVTVATQRIDQISAGIDDQKLITNFVSDSKYINGDIERVTKNYYGDGKFYIELPTQKDDEFVKYVSDTDAKQFSEFYMSYAPDEDISGYADLSKFENVTKVNVKENAFSIKYNTPQKDYLPEIYKIFKSDIELQLPENSELTDFEGITDIDANGNITAETVIIKAKYSDDESAVIKKVTQYNAFDDSVTFAAPEKTDEFTKIESVPLLLDVMNVDILKDIKNGSFTYEDKISVSGPFKMTVTDNTKVTYATKDGKFSFDSTNKITASLLGQTNVTQVTEKYSDGTYTAKVDKEESEPVELTEDEARDIITSKCKTVPYEFSDCVKSVSVSEKDGKKVYTLKADGEQLTEIYKQIFDSAFGEDTARMDFGDATLNVTTQDSAMLEFTVEAKITMTMQGLTFTGKITTTAKVAETEQN